VAKFTEMIVVNLVKSKAAAKLELKFNKSHLYCLNQLVEHISWTQAAQQSVTKFTEMIVVNLFKSKTVAKLKL
jgi:hypothetical protein